jgi:hypothetical protein
VALRMRLRNQGDVAGKSSETAAVNRHTYWRILGLLHIHVTILYNLAMCRLWLSDENNWTCQIPGSTRYHTKC